MFSFVFDDSRYFKNINLLKEYSSLVSYNVVVLLTKDDIQRKTLGDQEGVICYTSTSKIISTSKIYALWSTPFKTKRRRTLLHTVLFNMFNPQSITDLLNNQITTVISQRVEEEAMTEVEVRILVHHKLKEILEVH